jgi:hypothetical protein
MLNLRIFFLVTLMVICATVTFAKTDLTDPYEILKLHFVWLMKRAGHLEFCPV